MFYSGDVERRPDVGRHGPLWVEPLLIRAVVDDRETLLGDAELTREVPRLLARHDQNRLHPAGGRVDPS
jgi:hypothetical protein